VRLKDQDRAERCLQECRQGLLSRPFSPHCYSLTPCTRLHSSLHPAMLQVCSSAQNKKSFTRAMHMKCVLDGKSLRQCGAGKAPKVTSTSLSKLTCVAITVGSIKPCQLRDAGRRAAAAVAAKAAAAKAKALAAAAKAKALAVAAKAAAAKAKAAKAKAARAAKAAAEKAASARRAAAAKAAQAAAQRAKAKADRARQDAARAATKAAKAARERDARCKCSGSKRVKMYEHHHGKGGGKSYKVGNVRSMPQGWNDKVSSIKVPKGCKAILYEHNNYGGKSATYTQTPGLDNFSTSRRRKWSKNNAPNDQVSSFKVMNAC
jgi:hypothetical protein